MIPAGSVGRQARLPRCQGRASRQRMVRARVGAAYPARKRLSRNEFESTLTDDSAMATAA